jgi:hypothetical protein
VKGYGRTVELFEVAHKIHKTLLSKFRKSGVRKPHQYSISVPAFFLCRWSTFSYIMDAEKIRKNVHASAAFGTFFLITGGFWNNCLSKKRLSESRRNKLSQDGSSKNSQN